MNLLIAMMSTTYTDVMGDAEQECGLSAGDAATRSSHVALNTSSSYSTYNIRSQMILCESLSASLSRTTAPY
jgi:hypothetical protein